MAQRIFQDQISAGHPAAPLVVSPILDAAGVLHSEPRLVLLPDDPALGQFRAEFGGTARHHRGAADRRRARLRGRGQDREHRGARIDRLENDQDERVDARAFLSARLVDLLAGGLGPHQDQWRWARLGNSDRVPWTPIPRDRDQAFARFDGLLLGLARLSATAAGRLRADLPSMVGLTWNARVLDRRLLSGLDWPVSGTRWRPRSRVA